MRFKIPPLAMFKYVFSPLNRLVKLNMNWNVLNFLVIIFAYTIQTIIISSPTNGFSVCFFPSVTMITKAIANIYFVLKKKNVELMICKKIHFEQKNEKH